MKKSLTSTLLFASVLALAMLACQTNETPLPQPTAADALGISVKKTRLVFSSIEAYRRVVDSPTEETRTRFLGAVDGLKEFTSLAETSDRRARSKADARTNGELIMSDYLRRMLNADLVVQIGAHLIKLNPRTEKVYVLPAALESQYADLVAENTANTNIRQFSAGQDVLTLLNKDGDIGILGCYDVFGPGNLNSIQGQDEINLSSSIKLRFTTEILCQNTGIFTILSEKMTCERQVGSSPWVLFPTGMKLNHSGNYKLPDCNSTVVNLTPPADQFVAFGTTISYTFYFNTAPFHKYKLKAIPKYPLSGANELGSIYEISGRAL